MDLGWRIEKREENHKQLQVFDAQFDLFYKEKNICIGDKLLNKFTISYGTLKPTTVNTVKFLPSNISSLFLVQLLPICTVLFWMKIQIGWQR